MKIKIPKNKFIMKNKNLTKKKNKKNYINLQFIIYIKHKNNINI